MSTKNNSYSGTVRIIAGRWRGRKIAFPALAGLRPTADRVRETLFNWLAPVMHGSSCLDLFAGSGVLGFEAMSRGAARVVMFEQARQAVQYLRNHCQMLAAEQITIIHQPASASQLKKLDHRFDIVFLDPPFATNLLKDSCYWLNNADVLNSGALIYLELNKGEQPCWPENWSLVKDKTAGQVRYCLCQYQPSELLNE